MGDERWGKKAEERSLWTAILKEDMLNCKARMPVKKKDGDASLCNKTN
jgi:hypothetical protein